MTGWLGCRRAAGRARGSCPSRSDPAGRVVTAVWLRGSDEIATITAAVTATTASRRARPRGAHAAASSEPATKPPASSSTLRHAAASSNTPPGGRALGLVSLWRAPGLAKMFRRAGLTASAPPSAVMGVVAITPQRGASGTWPPEPQPTDRPSRRSPRPGHAAHDAVVNHRRQYLPILEEGRQSVIGDHKQHAPRRRRSGRQAGSSRSRRSPRGTNARRRTACFALP